MKVAVDVSPLSSAKKNAHKVRGVGYYVLHLLSSLQAKYPQHQYLPFSNISEIPQDADLVHFTYFDPFFINLPFVKRKKYIVTVHDMIPLLFPNDFPPGIKGSMKWRVQRKLLERSDQIITDSKCSKEDIVKLTNIPRETITVVYLAVSDVFGQRTDASKLENVRKKYHLPETFVLYVGDVTANKNIPRLIRALGGRDIPLILVGKALSAVGFDRENVWNKDMVEVERLLKKYTNIIRLGFVPDEDLAVLYKLARVFVMPSLYEGFGLPVLEAMRSGCPVVTSRRGSLPEVAGDATIYVDPESEESILQGIRNILENDDLYKKFSVKGKEQSHKFSWDDTARFTQDVYTFVYNK
ncbi:MAG: glycosyltransferase family 1 protein [bacterium]|nr:glycosyltransferase family 1 protein [bacterium]